MPTFASPGVVTRELDLSLLAANNSTIVPAFIGTAVKGPLNTPTQITTAEQYIEIFGQPSPEANMGYSVIAFLEEGNSAWVMRVGVECSDGQVEDLADVCIDTSGTKIQGWGRVPVFAGIDFGRINLRVPTTAAPLAFHTDSVTDIDYNDADVSVTDGATVATLSFVGSDLSDTYTGAIDDSFTVLITGDPDSGSVLNMAAYELIRNSDGSIIGSGLLVESATLGISEPVAVGSGDDDSGLIFRVEVTGTSPLEQNDTFTFVVAPDNLAFMIEVEGVASVPASFSMTDGTSFTDPEDFVTAFNAIIGGSVDFLVGYDGTNLFLRTQNSGERIQLVGTEAFALEVGVQKWVWDIPRSNLVSTDFGPYNINANNNRVTLQVVSSTVITELESTVPVGSSLSPATVSTALNLGGISRGERFYNSFALQITDDDQAVAIVTAVDSQFSQLRMMADFSHIKTLRFAEEVGFTGGGADAPQPTRAYRVFNDPRVELPDPGVIDPSVPLSCESDPGSAQCTIDTAYYSNIVGYVVAPSPGTWLDGYTLNLESFNAQPGRYVFKLFEPSGLEEPGARVDNFSFDPNDSRYIANMVNPGSPFGGQSGNAWINWEDRPVFLDNDPTDTDFVVRQPGAFGRRTFAGMANGIPLDPVFSSELDAAVIGNSADATGLFAFQNTESIDISLLATPGFSSGQVIAGALQLAEGRGDTLYLVDPPFGLRPQQVIDWHNGMLFSDLSSSLNSSYGALYWSWVEVFDQFNGGTVFVPPSGHVAAVFARTARVGEPWFAPAGLNRGRLRTVLALEFNPTKGERDALYGFDNAVNPLVKFPQEGTVVFGQRTLQRADSALDRVNVRMLLTFIKKGLQPILRSFVFEPNDEITRTQVANVVLPFLADIQARRGITAFRVVVDETNNTPERIDRNELWISIWIKPTRVAEFVVLNLAVLRTDSSFASEEVLAAAGVISV